MIFRAKVDTFFTNTIWTVVLIIGAATLWPLFLEEVTGLAVVVILTSTFLVSTGFILWCAFSVKYVFYQDYLFVKGGPFRSRIPYEKITKVSSTTAIFIGYRILSSRDAIEIYYTTAALGSVKISPEDKEGFITELQKRSPNVSMDE